MKEIRVFIENGQKKTFAGALDWPGWCRFGRDENSALKALLDSGARYAQALRREGVAFEPPADRSPFQVVTRVIGNTTTDFGAPGIVLEAYREPVEDSRYERYLAILQACWRAFDQATAQAEGKMLRKGPRGGGRTLEGIINHILQADRAYLAKLAWKHKTDDAGDKNEALRDTREAVRGALAVAKRGELPEKGPRGGLIWPATFFVQRVAWHTLDHAWEIEDRIV